MLKKIKVDIKILLRRLTLWYFDWLDIGASDIDKKPVVDDTDPTTPKPDKPDVTPEPSESFPIERGKIGVDISHYNSKVDLVELSKNTSFIYMKATEGTTFVSNVYSSRAKKLNELKVKWGAYHYYRVNKNPIDQAKHFCKYVQDSGLPPVLDIEKINNNFKYPYHTEDLIRFLNEVETITKQVPMIYVGYYYARDVIKTDERFKKYPLWVAWYTDDFTRVKIPFPWKKATLWQYTDKGKAKGIDGNVDLNKVV